MKKDVVLLFGGNSEERLVSVASAQNLAAQFSFSSLVFQSPSEELFVVDLAELQSHREVFVSDFKPRATPFAPNIEGAISFFKDKIIFLGFHGSQGENGQVQELFERHRICFTGSGSKASHLAFEKNLGKEVMANTDAKMAAQMKLPVAKMNELLPKLEQFLQRHKRIVLKPTSSGSSFGLHIVENSAALQAACEKIKASGFEMYLAESFIGGRELTVGVVQAQNELIALPPSEVVVNEGRAFDYEGKYLGAGTKEITPAQLTAEEAQAAQKLAVDAHIAFGCYGYSRTDMILSKDGPYFLETNTLPGLSKPSFIPQQLLAADITVKSFIEDQLWLAEHRYEDN